MEAMEVAATPDVDTDADAAEDTTTTDPTENPINVSVQN